MSDKFKKHIIDNLQSPLVYNLLQLGISYNEETYKYFISQYFNIDSENIKIDYEGHEDEYEMIVLTLLSVDEDMIDYETLDSMEELVYIGEDLYLQKVIYGEFRRNDYLVHERYCYDINANEVYYQKVKTDDITFIPPWLSPIQ